MEQTLTGSADFGRKVTSLIARNGDLVHKGFLKIELPELAVTGAGNTVAWTRHVGQFLIDEISVEIGGATIDKHYGLWYHVYNELTQPAAKEVGYQVMIGDQADLTVPKATIPAKTLFVPLCFWFNRNPGLALPLIALMYHDVKINIAFRQAADLIIFGGGATKADLTTPNPSLKNVSLHLDYIFLDAPERRMFSQLNHEYLIEQVQYQGSESYSNGAIRQKLSFSHPTKAVIWVIQPTANVAAGANRLSDFTHNPTGPDFYNGQDPLKDAKLQLNTTDRVGTMPAAYWGLVQPYNHWPNCPPTGIYSYSFALKPDEHQPSGTLNMSRIEGVNLVMTLNTGIAPVTISPFALSYNVLRITSGMGGLAYAS